MTFFSWSYSLFKRRFLVQLIAKDHFTHKTRSMRNFPVLSPHISIIGYYGVISVDGPNMAVLKIGLAVRSLQVVKSDISVK